jgi:hypothetical protein
MRSLTATLLAAQKQPSSQPYVSAQLLDYYGDVGRLHFARVYSGAEGEYYSAACAAPDGSLVRARIDPATKLLYTQRVATPGAGSNFASWSSIATVSASGAVALCADATTVYLFYVDTDTLTLRLRTSADNGASFGSASTVATASGAAVYLAAAIKPGGDRVLFWTEGAAVYRSRYSGGAWGARTAWTLTAASLTGIACVFSTGWDLVVCGTAPTTGDAKVWTAIFGDGTLVANNTWSPLLEVTTATAATNVTFRSPAIDASYHWRLYFVEKYTGSVAYSRLQLATMNSFVFFDSERWHEAAAFEYPTIGSGQTTADYGVAAARTGDAVWLSAAAGVWRAGAPVTPSLDVSADVVEASVDLSVEDGRARIILRNDPAATGDAGRYSAYGSGDAALIRRGVQLDLAPGYRTTAGDEAAPGPSFWVESIELQTGVRPRLVINARDGWWLLERWRARRQFVWPANTPVLDILGYVCRRAGLDASEISGSAPLSTLQPAFTIHPGESAKTAVRRLLAMVPDVGTMAGTRLLIYNPLPDDDAVYAYAAPGSTGVIDGHALTGARYRDIDPGVNRVRVLGAGVFTEAFNFAEADAAGESLVQVVDANLTTAAQAGDRAATELLDPTPRQRRDEVQLAGVNCGQELIDVVTVTDPQAGLDAAPRRVLGLSWRYSTGERPRYDMSLMMGDV